MVKEVFISRYPVYSTYAKEKGYSREEIDSDIIYTLQKRLYGMSEAERQALNITSEKFSSANLHNLLKEGQIKLIYNKRSTIGKPSYHIQMDIEGDGTFAHIPNPMSPDAQYIPERPMKRMRNMNISSAREVVSSKRGKGLINWLTAKGIQFQDYHKSFENVATNLAYIYTWGERAGNVFQEFLNDSIGTSFADTTKSQQYLQQLIQETVALETAMRETGRDIPGQYLKGGIQMNDKDGTIVRSENPLFDHIANNEGFEANAYQDSEGIWTIGHGFALDVKTDEGIVPHTELINALIDKGYNIDKLKSGEESLSIKDSVDLALDTTIKTAHNRVTKHYGQEIMGSGNGFLRIALTDMMYQTGDGKKSFAGPNSQFFKHINNLESEIYSLRGELKSLAHSVDRTSVNGVYMDKKDAKKYENNSFICH